MIPSHFRGTRYKEHQMGSSVRLPRTINSATKRLTDLDSLATATGWERAAIVYAFTYEGTGGPRTVRVSGQLTIRQFAEQKIKGLSNKDTVSWYRKVWKEHGEDVKPGQAITLPTEEFPQQSDNQGSRVSADPVKAVKQVIDKHGADVVAKHTASSAPGAVARQVAQPEVARQIAKSRALSNTVNKAQVDEAHPGYRDRLQKTQAKRRAQQDANDAAAGEMIRAIDGEHPVEDEMSMALMHARRAVKERELFAPSENQAARIEIQVDEMDVLMKALRGLSVLDEDALQAILEEG
jgi:hypothetical protein